ncbi:MAG: class I SAM-dependent methyltransferase [Methanomicrobiales archaeon]|nr:class I SAM-dependent methyltransferase [Methanomicrobiales archaeon]
MIREIIKRFSEFVEFDTHSFLFRIFERNARRIYNKNYELLDPYLKELLDGEDERFHYGDIELIDKASQYVTKTFTIARILFIQKVIPRWREKTMADLGDSNGIFLKALAKTGISLNISETAVKSIYNKNIDVIRADVECLPFRADSVDVVLLFETFEHVPNPILLMHEIGRICRDSLILSIPSVSKTSIYPSLYDSERPLHQHHIFEMNHIDFTKIISHTPFRIASDEIITVLDGKGTFFERIIFLLWHYFMEREKFCSCFRQFRIYHLKKDRS